MMNKLILGLVTLASLGTLVIPAYADVANVQESTQITTQNGDGNTSFQRNTQTIRVHQGGSRRSGESENQGNVQSSSQDTLQEGYDNYSDVVNEQHIRSSNNRSRSR